MIWRFIHRSVSFVKLSFTPRGCRYLGTSSASRQSEQFVPFGQQNHYDPIQLAMAKQWKLSKSRGGQKRRKLDPEKEKWPDGSHEDVLKHEVQELLNQPKRQVSNGNEEAEQAEGHFAHPLIPDEEFHGVEVEIETLSSIGEGLARSAAQDHVYVIPFTLPGERVLARVRSETIDVWSNADLVKVLQASPKREGVKPGCKYFGTCSGCQLQMLPYEEQLAHKKTIVERAYQNFSGLQSSQIPTVADTGPSPLQYGYRTKLTPHFDGPPREKGRERRYTSIPPIGFTQKGRKKVMDIESCPIGTEIIQEGLKRERAKVHATISSFKNGATILLRETTERIFDKESTEPATSLTPLPLPTSKELTTTSDGRPELRLEYATRPFTDIESYVRDERASSTEYVGAYKFTTRAGSFFQNNNSILPSFLNYIRANALPPLSKNNTDASPKVKYLLDAYSGSGLFALTLSPLFTSVLGIELDPASVKHAHINAKDNHISNCGFIEADASDLFADVPYPPSETVVVIDPPRKGCSKEFLKQLLGFGARRVVYVSCNVNSQARDVGVMVRGGFEGSEAGEGRGWRYEIEILRGWDFFPQTGHVEGVCVLNRVEKIDEKVGKDAWEEMKVGK